ncbi:transmembrane protein, putative [Bodo saltans]|uniref:Transmembrane protein, putative n=1 Tax=Bodo saltans TaxID=75058 RepID=A0A0S4IRM5_BODSA|nr:transmembrane protein, putative [Bodo saltans]|eukprot:CUE69997.1 transmembrane protein, putative [Bodo saltans]
MDFLTSHISRGADLLFKKDPRVEALLHPSPDDLDGLDHSIANLRGPSGTAAAPELVFQYSAALISHVNPLHIKEGITLMESLVFQYWAEERRRANAAAKQATVAGGLAATAPPSSDAVDELPKKKQPSLLPIYYYYMSLGWVKLDDPHKAKACITRMLDLEPQNPQGKALEAYIDQQQTRDGVIGLAGLSAAIAAAAVVVGTLRNK